MTYLIDVRKSDQTTDGHLLDLATMHGAQFATLDTGIPGAILIPKETDAGWMVREEPATYRVAA